MIEAKYRSPRFGQLPADELVKSAWGLLVKIHIITGWTIPQDESIQDELVKQFTLKLTESYTDVNSDEMEYAFRNNPIVKDWGKAMNLNLIEEVMQPYLSKRLELSRFEENKKAKMVALPPSASEDVSDDQFIESVYTLYKTVGDFKMIPLLAYDILDKQKTWTREQKNKVIQFVDDHFGKQQDKTYYRQVAVASFFDTTYKSEK